MKRTYLILLTLLLLISVFTIAGCKTKRTMISSILQQPDRYLNSDVAVAGRVTETHTVNLFIAEAGAYKLDDGSGTIWVITKTGVPQRGDEIGLTGKVDGGVKLLGETFGCVIREQERRRR
jgi:hypothetical protein